MWNLGRMIAGGGCVWRCSMRRIRLGATGRPELAIRTGRNAGAVRNSNLKYNYSHYDLINPLDRACATGSGGVHARVSCLSADVSRRVLLLSELPHKGAMPPGPRRRHRFTCRRGASGAGIGMLDTGHNAIDGFTGVRNALGGLLGALAFHRDFAQATLAGRQSPGRPDRCCRHCFRRLSNAPVLSFSSITWTNASFGYGWCSKSKLPPRGRALRFPQSTGCSTLCIGRQALADRWPLPAVSAWISQLRRSPLPLPLAAQMTIDQG